MPVKASTYVLAQGDFLVIEDVSVSSNNIIGFGINYNPAGPEADSFHYIFIIDFEGDEGLESFSKIRQGLEMNEKILWYNPDQKFTLPLIVEDVVVDLADADMIAEKKQIMRVVAYAESDELVESEAS